MKIQRNEEKKPRLNFRMNMQQYALIIVLVLIVGYFTIMTGGDFLSSRNISNLFLQMTVVAILAIGMTFVIVASHIDLSVGSLAGLAGGIAAILNVHYDWDTGIVILVAVVIGILLGLFQGWWVAYQGLPAFIVTLGGNLLFRGILIGMTGGQTISSLDSSFRAITSTYLPYSLGYILAVVGVVAIFYSTWKKRTKRDEMGLELPSPSVEYGRISLFSIGILLITYTLNRYLGIPFSLLIVVILAGIAEFTTQKTPFGRSLYAIGGNAEAAELSGINIKRNSFAVFGIMGALAGLAGIILTSRLNAATPSAGQGYDTDAIASVVIGGTSLAGGTGNIVGSLIGAIIMVSISNGMSMMNIPAYWQYIVRGSILILAVWVDITSKKKSQA